MVQEESLFWKYRFGSHHYKDAVYSNGTSEITKGGMIDNKEVISRLSLQTLKHFEVEQTKNSGGTGYLT